MSSPGRKGFSKLPLIYIDVALTRDEAATLLHLHLRKRYKAGEIEFQPGQSILVGAEACLVSVREIAQVVGLTRMTAFRCLRRLEAKGLVHLTALKRACLIVRVLTQDEIKVSRTVVGQLERALLGQKPAHFLRSKESTGTVVGQHVGHRISVKNSQKEGVKAVHLRSSWDSEWDSRCFKNRYKSVDADFDAVFVDKSGFHVDKVGEFHGAPLRRPYSPYGAILGNLALSVEEVPKDAPEGQAVRFPMVLRSASQSESDNVYTASQNGLKNPAIIPTCASVRPLRLYPQCEDFDSHAQWTLAQYEPLRAISRYRAGLTGRADQLNQGRALAELRKHFDSFRIAAAIRDVERNGTVGSCAWEVPKLGTAAYLVEAMPAVLARIERLAYQRERRRLAAARGRQRRKFQDRSPRVHAFRDAFPDRRERRWKMDLLRARYWVLFAEIPRASVAELGVVAQVWGQE